MKPKPLPAVLKSLILSILLSACTENQLPEPAPVDQISSLENLADSYRTVLNTLPVQPQKLPPSGKREFLEQVFQNADYDYSATLIALSRSKLDPFNQNQRDLTQLLFLPLEGLEKKDYEKIYSQSELQAIEKIQKTFR